MSAQPPGHEAQGSRGDPGPLGSGAPVVVLVDPQMGENIGAAARAMLNCCWTEMRLVRPRDGWPNDKARAMASGADIVIDGVQVYDKTAAAIGDLQMVLATTARPRDMTKPVFEPQTAAQELRARAARQQRCGILFGPERSGLTNDDIALADAVLTVPLNPGFASLNLAQAVLLVGYCWFALSDSTAGYALHMPGSAPASKAEIENLFVRAEEMLDQGGFFASPDMRPVIMRNLRNALGRAGLSTQEVQTLHGVFKAALRAGRSTGP